MFRLTLFSACLLLPLCASFAPLLSRQRHATTTTRLASSVAGNYWEHDDLHFRQMISKARECAFSDELSDAGAARVFLNEILHLESGCASGTLSGDICNVDEVADIVAHLRVKAAAAAVEPTAPDTAVTLMSTTVVLMMVAILLTTVSLPGSDATPFTLQEWYWAFQGGFMDQMVEHYMRNGGI